MTAPFYCFRSVHEGHRHTGSECRDQLWFSEARWDLPAQDWSIRPVRSHGRGRQPNHVWRQVSVNGFQIKYLSHFLKQAAYRLKMASGRMVFSRVSSMCSPVFCRAASQRWGAVVRECDWQSSRHGFEFCWGSLETLAISFTPLCQCLSEIH